MAEMMGDKDKMAETLALHTQLIKDHDKDGDGKLNKEEWMAYAQTSFDQAPSQGWQIPEANKEEWEFTFDAYCRANGTDSLTAEQIFSCSGQKQKAVKEALGE